MSGTVSAQSTSHEVSRGCRERSIVRAARFDGDEVTAGGCGLVVSGRAGVQTVPQAMGGQGRPRVLVEQVSIINLFEKLLILLI